MAQNTGRLNVTRIGLLSGADGQQILHVTGDKVANKPAILALDAVDPSTTVITTYYLWVDSTGTGGGKLRISATFPTTEISDGTIVGTQTA